MRRLPVYFVIDVSESMVGEPIQQVQEGMRSIIHDLRSDPYALETVFVSIIAFAGKAHSLTSLEELYKFNIPDLPIGGGTALGDALQYLMKDLDKSIQKTTAESKGDWKPIIFLFTDGVPTDNPSKAISAWNKTYRNKCNLIAVSLGNNVDTHLLGQMTDTVLRLAETDRDSFKAFFKWVTASIKTSSVSVSDYADDTIKLPSTDGINLEKVDTREHVSIDENVAIILGKCSTSKKSYLIKFTKTSPHNSTFQYENVYPIEETSYKRFSANDDNAQKIHTGSLEGGPETCPYCSNSCGLVGCGDCGNISCGSIGKHWKCPWCGVEGELEYGSFDMSRARG